MFNRNVARRAFTLVEIMIVILILGVLAAIVIPQFTSAQATARDNSIKMDLHRIRQQIQIYAEQHSSVYPKLATFEAQMTLASDLMGATATPGTSGYNLGPYLREVPINPYTANNTVSAGAVGSSAWYYNESNGDFRANDSATSRAY